MKIRSKSHDLPGGGGALRLPIVYDAMGNTVDIGGAGSGECSQP